MSDSNMDNSNEIDFYQFVKPLAGISDLEWAQIRRIARECHEAGMHEGNQFKVAIEAFSRWHMQQELNENLDQESNEVLFMVKH